MDPRTIGALIIGAVIGVVLCIMVSVLAVAKRADEEAEKYRKEHENE